MLRCTLALALTAVAAADWAAERAATPGYSYTDYLADFDKKHGGPEAEQAFVENLRTILAHNARQEGWLMGVNHFTDWSRAKFRAKRLAKTKRPSMPLVAEASPILSLNQLPTSVDWREKGVVTKVKDQGDCGSCWAFSATETMESAVAIATGKNGTPGTLLTLSEQQIVSCMPNPTQCGGTGGCNGAIEEEAFNYTRDTGLTEEKDYPYKSGNSGKSGTCEKSKIKPAASVKGYVAIPKNNYTALMTAVATVGPVSISAAAEPWQMYSSGIFSQSNCGYDTDHGIQLVGYGEEDGKKYWLVRNSWARDWGEKGYIRIKRYGEGEEPCGMDKKPQDGSGCKGDTKPIKYCGLCGIMSDSSYPTGGYLINPPAPTPAPAPTPVPPPTPKPVVRYHCDKSGLFPACVKADQGHSTKQKCEETCG